MATEIFIDMGSEITAVFAGGGVLEKSGTLWIYDRDGRSCSAREPESAVIGAEGLLNGKLIWNSVSEEVNEL